MSENLISGLYKKIKEQKVENQEFTDIEYDFTVIVRGLVDFIKNNPDLTNADVKLLASTNKQKYVYFDVIFNEFPNVVEEVRKNGTENILKMFKEKTENGYIFQNMAYRLNSIIEKEYRKHRNKLVVEFTNKYDYNYFGFSFEKQKDNRLRYSRSHKEGYSSGTVQYTTDIKMYQVCQILGFVKFYQQNNLEYDTLKAIIKNNYIYDFSALRTIINNSSNYIMEYLQQEEYGFYQLFKLFEIGYNKEKEKINNTI